MNCLEAVRLLFGLFLLPVGSQHERDRRLK